LSAEDYFVILNAAAPRYPPETIREALDKVFAERGAAVRVFEVPPGPDSRARVAHEVKRALAEGYGHIIAVGGDGTVSMAAEGLARNGGHPDAVLGIVPAGTANVLARELGIPVSLESAVATIAEGRGTIELDAILAAGRTILTQVGIGPDAVMIRETSRASQARLGRLAYVTTFVRRAMKHPARRYTLTIDGSKLLAHAWQIVVANAGSLGAPPFTWGPRIDPTDGVLDVCVYDVHSMGAYLRLAWRVILGKHRKDENTRFFRVRECLTVECNRPVLVQGDGELLGRTPVTLQVLPRAVRVAVARPVEEDPGAPPASPAKVEGAPAVESVTQNVEAMLAQQSRTWVLQGALRHPIAALEALDAALFLRVNTWNLGAIPDRTLAFISRVMLYGEGWAIVVLAMMAVDFGRGLRTAAEAFPVIGATMLTIHYPMKRVFRRRRPFIAFVKARVLGPRPKDFSFPSGHSAAGFAGAVVLTPHAPALGPAFYALAVVMALSRVYLGVHYPSDVAFGAMLGAALASLYRLLLGLLLPGLV